MWAAEAIQAPRGDGIKSLQQPQRGEAAGPVPCLARTWQAAVAAVFVISTCTFSLLSQVLWGLAAISEKRDGVPAPPGRPPGRAPEAVPETMGGDEAAPDLRWGEGDPAVPLPAEGG